MNAAGLLPLALLAAFLPCVIGSASPWQIVAGIGKSGFGGASQRSLVHGFGVETRLSSPWGLALHAAVDRLYIADRLNNNVRSLHLKTGLLETIAGTGDPGFSGDGGAGTEALLRMPTGLALDATTSTLYISDTQNHRIRALSLRPGRFYQAEAADNSVTMSGPAARLTCPTSVAPSASALLLGSRYCSGATGSGYADFLHTIEDKIEFTVQGTHGAGTYDLRFRYADRYSEIRAEDSRKLRLTVNGVVLTHALRFLPSGHRYSAGSYSEYSWTTYSASLLSGNNRVGLQVTGHGGPHVDLLYVIPPQPLIRTVLGNGVAQLPVPEDSSTSQLATNSSLHSPMGLAIDAASQVLYVADTDNGRVRRLNLATGRVTTLAGSTQIGNADDGIAAVTGKLFRPTGLALDASATYLYVTDARHNRVRRIDLTSRPNVGGTISSISGSGFSFGSFSHTLGSPQDLVVDGAASILYIADHENSRIREVNLAESCRSKMESLELDQNCATPGVSRADCLSLGCCYENPCGSPMNQDGRATYGFAPEAVLTRLDGAQQNPPISFVAGGTGACCHPHLREMATLDLLDFPQGLALDTANKLLYVSQADRHRVVRMRLIEGRCSASNADVC
eukprot:TRINITY_DN48905_c0_g1_i1.p1 TRINITY_DN48905_c0_g1~~TRINITY_DN48905_c0_g1_i1.p1  ORF type:complete len:621 (-),score=77.36 TRINITY_DN48905_c0_g1_i1:51-1913(-)